jgi:flagellar hook protein FlgE
MSFQQGLSGLNATSKSLEVIGNNIANSATYGFKASRAEFADVYAAALNGAGTSNIGIGVNLAAVSQQFTQGNILSTENAMDLAINGAGFFQVTDGNSPVEFSRNGQFKIDRDGYIVNNELQKLLGYPASAAGVIQPGAAVPLQLPTSGINPQVTTQIDMEFNLDSRVAATAPAVPPAINYADPTTYNNATSMSVYDDRGTDVALTYYFQKSGADTWNVFLTANGTTVGGIPAAPAPVTTITFPPAGTAPTSPIGPVSVNIPASVNAAGAATLPIPNIQLDLTSSTHFGTSFGVTNMTQDGFAPASSTASASSRTAS